MISGSLWTIFSFAAIDQILSSRPPPQRHPPPRLSIVPCPRGAEGYLQAGRFQDREGVVREGGLDAGEVEGRAARRVVALPEGGDRSAAQLEALAAVAGGGDGVAREGGVE